MTALLTDSLVEGVYIMFTHISVPLPDHIQQHIRSLSHENFSLWMFIAQNDLLEEASDFLSDCSTCSRLLSSHPLPFPCDDEDDF